MLRLFLAFTRKLSWVILSFGQLLLIFAAVLAFYQVVARFLLETPSVWTEVLTRSLLIWMVYIGIGIAFRQGAMVSIDLLRNSCKGPYRTCLEALITLAIVSFLVLAAWYGGKVAWAVRFQTLAGLGSEERRVGKECVSR